MLQLHLAAYIEYEIVEYEYVEYEIEGDHNLCFYNKFRRNNINLVGFIVSIDFSNKIYNI